MTVDTYCSFLLFSMEALATTLPISMRCTDWSRRSYFVEGGVGGYGYRVPRIGSEMLGELKGLGTYVVPLLHVQ